MILDHAILGLLNRRSLTGYELKKSFDQSVRHFWTADQSHIYRVLGRLNAQGYVRFVSVPQEGKPNRKVYHITPHGREQLIRWLRSGKGRVEIARDPYLVHLFFAALVSNEEMLDMLREDVERAGCFLAEYEEISEQSLALAAKKPSRERFFWYLTVDYGMWMRRAYLEWLNRTIERIERGEPDSSDWHERFPSPPDEEVAGTELDSDGYAEEIKGESP